MAAELDISGEMRGLGIRTHRPRRFKSIPRYVLQPFSLLVYLSCAPSSTPRIGNLRAAMP
ncbi:hypothetical protein Fmac_014366 [Flemingia macrophylla]|uniref:Uncharacterized protein n=1 Tax=Flemingia macrophylla TaxID=520843 RepID=A0ABD1MC89_9FABA